MHPIVRNILAVIAGGIGGSVINMLLVQAGHLAFPFEGIDITDMAALAAVMPTLTAKHFIFPFFAHALGTLSGAAIAASIAVSHKKKFAIGIGCFFLLGGVVVSFMIPAPIWFVFLDLSLAYIPMALIGAKLVIKNN